MIFWILAPLIALAAAAILMRALLRGAAKAPAAAYDLRIYRDQLKEVQRDTERGVIGPDEAERLQNEVSRRILAADKALQGETGRTRTRADWPVLLLAVALIPAALLLYRELGAPGYADLPRAERLAASTAARADRLSQSEAEDRAPPVPPADIVPETEELMQRLRKAVEQHPKDQRGLALLTEYEARLGNLSAAGKAQGQLIALKGKAATAADYADWADLMISAAGGYVSKDAEAALRGALERDQENEMARYYMGLYLMQVGRPDMAFRTWKTLMGTATPDDPWFAPLRSALPGLAARAGVEYELPPAPDGAAIEGMVASLASRLANEGGPAGDWARLITSYGVLGQTEQAAAIWAEARQVFAGRAGDIATLRQAAEEAGVAE